MSWKHKSKPETTNHLHGNATSISQNTHTKTNNLVASQESSASSSPESLLGCGLVYPHLLLGQLSQQSGVKTPLEALCEPQVRLEADLVGPEQRRAAPGSAEVAHGLQQLVQAVVGVDHIRR